MPKGKTLINEAIIRDVVTGKEIDKAIRRSVRTKLLKDAKSGSEIAAGLLERVKSTDLGLQLKRGRKPTVSYESLSDLVPDYERE